MRKSRFTETQIVSILEELDSILDELGFVTTNCHVYGLTDTRHAEGLGAQVGPRATCYDRMRLPANLAHAGNSHQIRRKGLRGKA